MKVGNSNRLAIESTAEEAFEARGILFNGYIFIDVNGCRFGSGLLSAWSGFYARVEESIVFRGRHVFSHSQQSTAQHIAESVCSAIYGDESAFKGLPTARNEIRSQFYDHQLTLASPVMEAWDDGTVVLQLDEGESVRVVAFVICDPASGTHVERVEECRLSANEYYGILEHWRDACDALWRASKKTRLE